MRCESCARCSAKLVERVVSRLSVRSRLRKIIPLRACVFEDFRKNLQKDLEKGFAETREEVDNLKGDLASICAEIRKIQEGIESLSKNLNALDASDALTGISRSLDEVAGRQRGMNRHLDDFEGRLKVKMEADFQTMSAKVDAAKMIAYRTQTLLRPTDGGELEGDGDCGQATAVKEPPKTIVSLTSYPPRIQQVHRTIETLLEQTVAPDMVILWLASEQFPLGEAELPDALVSLKKQGLVIRWRDDLKAHKKYFYAMKEYPQSDIITVDDDMLYDKDAVETLLTCKERHPGCICARRARRIAFDSEGGVAPYASWELCTEVDAPDINLIATGVGGVLYPAGVFGGDLLDADLIRDVCPQSDDLWLKTMGMVAEVPVVLSDANFAQHPVEGTQATSLYLADTFTGRNDRDIRKIVDALSESYPGIWRSDAC